ncbi:hypothetical protein BHE74_00046537 [Ensete ventricosum]|nr:hypothetical protein BHE74_00046537 [Ensete ventricosum]
MGPVPVPTYIGTDRVPRKLIPYKDHPKLKIRKGSNTRRDVGDLKTIDWCIAEIMLVGDRGPGSRQWCTNSSERRVFRVCASKLALDESLGRQHMGAMYHRGRSQIVSTNESHGGDVIIQRYDRSGWRVGLLQCSHSLKGARQDFHGVIDPLLLWRESIGRKRGRGGGECKGKLQVSREGGRAEVKKLHKTDVDGLLIKIAESVGLRVDAGVLDQGTK